MEFCLTIIVPCYNVANCVEDTLYSLYNESCFDLEVILINDGSSDETKSVIENFLFSYPIINCRLISIKNEGLSNARNLGIELACGKFIWFLDGDDVIRLGSVSSLIFFIKEYTDISIFAFQAFDFEDRVLGSIKENYEGYNDWLIESYHRDVNKIVLTNSKDYIIDKISKDKFLSNACMYIINRKLLIEKKLVFLYGVVYEDILFTLELFMMGTFTIILPNRFILHRRRNGSITRSSINKNHINSMYKIVQNIKKLSIMYSVYTELKQLEKKFLLLALRKTRDNGFSVLIYFLKYPGLLISNFIRYPEVKTEIVKNIKHSLKKIIR